MPAPLLLKIALPEQGSSLGPALGARDSHGLSNGNQDSAWLYLFMSLCFEGKDRFQLSFGMLPNRKTPGREGWKKKWIPNRTEHWTWTYSVCLLSNPAFREPSLHTLCSSNGAVNQSLVQGLGSQPKQVPSGNFLDVVCGHWKKVLILPLELPS